MSEYVSFLISVLHDNGLLKCGLKVKIRDLVGDCRDAPMEPENRVFLHGLLPLHVRSCGPVVDVEEIFEIEVKS